MQSRSHEQVAEAAQRGQVATAKLRSLPRSAKDHALTTLADALVSRRNEILDANMRDVTLARDNGIIYQRLNRLILDEPHLEALAYGLRTLAAVPDPVGEVIRGRRQRSGVEICQIRVPIGVVAVLHEGQPAAVVQALGSLLKTGNALLVFDTHDTATHTNEVLARILSEALADTEVPTDAVRLITGHPKAIIRTMITAKGEIDLVVPLLENGIPAQLLPEAAVPIIQIGSGNCHVYIDAAADLELAERIVLDSKIGHTALSHAAETILVHADIAEQFVPTLCASLKDNGVTVHGDERVVDLAPDCIPATEDDWDRDYRSMHLAFAVVDSADAAALHIAKHGTRHTEAVVTADMEVARIFAAKVDAATVVVNTATTFAHSGANLMDPELAFSTQRLNPRGPLGVSEFTTTKWLAWPSKQAFRHQPSHAVERVAEPKHKTSDMGVVEIERVVASAQHRAESIDAGPIHAGPTQAEAETDPPEPVGLQPGYEVPLPDGPMPVEHDPPQHHRLSTPPAEEEGPRLPEQGDYGDIRQRGLNTAPTGSVAEDTWTDDRDPRYEQSPPADDAEHPVREFVTSSRASAKSA